MTYLIVIRNHNTNEKRTFEVGIDPNKVNLTSESDAVFAVRGAHALWDRMKYPLHKAPRVIVNGIRQHDEVVELGENNAL